MAKLTLVLVVSLECRFSCALSLMEIVSLRSFNSEVKLSDFHVPLYESERALIR